MEQIDFAAKELFYQIKDKIKNKQIIFFCEIHGSKEIPLILAEFFRIFSQEEDFDLALEVPRDNQEKIDNFLMLRNEEILKEISFFKQQENSDGRNSLEYLQLIKTIAEINLQRFLPIRILCIDISLQDKFESQNEREEGMADNIFNLWKKEKKMFVILGNVHISKKQFILGEKIISPVACHLAALSYPSPRIFSVNLQPRTGEFFNFGIKRVEELSEDVDKSFDQIFFLDKISPCSFVENNP